MTIESVRDSTMKMIESLKTLAYKCWELEDSELPDVKDITETAFNFGNVLPKLSDSSLFEIDDLLYEDDDVTPTAASGASTEELETELRNECVESYIKIYTTISHQPANRTLDRIFLQAIRVLPVENHFGFNVQLYAEQLMSARSTTNLCRSLKILKIFLENNKEIVMESWQKSSDRNYLFLWMKKLQNFPEARDPHKKRITSWLSYQTALILQTMNPFVLNEETQNYLDWYNARPEPYDKRYIHRMAFVEFHHMSFINDHIYSYFMSANDEEDKIQRLKDFLIGVSCNYREDDEADFEYVPITYFVLPHLDRFINFYDKSFDPLLEGWGYPDDTLRSIEKHCGCEVKHYLLRDNANDVVEESNSYLKDDNISNKTNFDDEPDYTIEKFIFYDDFVKQLQSLNILHTACMMCQELLGTEGDIFGHDTTAFRGKDYYITRYLKDVHADPSKRGKIPWIVEVLLEKCPFMILPKRFEHMVGDLIKMLKGEVIDEMTEENLYFLLNCLGSDMD